jgi:hypothetical protein
VNFYLFFLEELFFGWSSNVFWVVFLFSSPSPYWKCLEKCFEARISPFQKGFFLGGMGERGGLVAFKGEGDEPK